MSLCLKRKSIRQFTEEPVSDDMIETLLKSAMQAPSARNQQPWEFIVIKNRTVLEKLSEVSGGAKPISRAPLGVLTLMREDVGAPHMRPQDMAAATHNILLEATNLGLGAVWIGVYPLEERVKSVASKVMIKKGLTPFSLIAIGYPDQDPNVTNYRYDPTRVQVIE